MSTNSAFANPAQKLQLKEENLLIYGLTGDEFREVDEGFYKLLKKLANADFPPGVIAYYYMRTADNLHMLMDSGAIIFYPGGMEGKVWVFGPLKGDSFEGYKCSKEKKACLVKLTLPKDGEPGNFLLLLYDEERGVFLIGLGEYDEDGAREETLKITEYNPGRAPYEFKY